MESNGETEAAILHVMFLPFPAQGHLTPMLRLAKILHARGSFRITFVNTEFNHARLVRSRGPGEVRGVDGFRQRRRTVEQHHHHGSDGGGSHGTLEAVVDQAKRPQLLEVGPSVDLLAWLGRAHPSSAAAVDVLVPCGAAEQPQQRRRARCLRRYGRRAAAASSLGTTMAE